MEDLFSNMKINIDLDSKVDYDDYKTFVKENIINILKRHFPNNRSKQMITEHHDRISFACPICDDSMSNHTKKRGNFILKGQFANHIKCFNCGYFSGVENFFKRYNVTMDLSVVNYIADNKNLMQKTEKYEAGFLFDTEYINEVSIDREEFKSFFKVYEIQGTFAQKYLENRLVYDTEKFLYDVKNNALFILNITDTGKILGYQCRSFNKYSKVKYMTYKLSRIYQMMGKDSSVVTEDIDALSSVFYACIVDWTKPVTAFEGPIDALLFKNSVGMTGVAKSLNFDIYMRYWLDKDTAGTKKSVELLNSGVQVFLWTKFMNDYNIPSRKKWDLNDLLIYLREKKIYVKNFNKYFSNSQYDMIDL